MTRQFTSFLGSTKFLKAAFVVFIAVYVLLIGSRFLQMPWEVANKDHYKDLFIAFLQNGYWHSNLKGTTILYNVFLEAIYFLTHNIDASFFILNLACDLFYLAFGIYFYRKLVAKSDTYSVTILSIYCLYILNQRSYLSASNDTFLGVFIMLLLYLLLVTLQTSQQYLRNFFVIGCILALCFATRITAVFLIPLVAVAFFRWAQHSLLPLAKKIQLLAVTVLTFMALTFACHYPSLSEKHTLSYESKEPGNGMTWVQRNYLGLKKIEQGKAPVNRDVIWKDTKFDVVARYLQEHGEESLPKTFSEVVVKDPILLAKMSIYNIVTVFFRFIRFWGLLFVIPFFMFFKRRYSAYRLPFLLFTIFSAAVSVACFTFVEFRWFSGYEILVPIAIAVALRSGFFSGSSAKTNMLVSSSLLLITAFNLKTVLASWL
jgi:hypothetical protein